MSNQPNQPNSLNVGSPIATPTSAGWKAFTSLAEFSDQADKILSFLGKVLAPVFAILWLLYGCLEDEVPRLPRLLLFVAIAGLIGVGLLVWLVTYVRRAKFNKWICLLLTVIGGLLVGLAGLFFYLAPKSPEWERLNVPDILFKRQHEKRQEKHDLPIILALGELAGRGNLFPGGQTYQKLLSDKYDGRLAESWAGYYAPLLAPSTMPIKLSLKSGGEVNSKNASVGVFLFVWNESDGEVVKVSVPQEFGYRKLQGSINVPVTLNRNERAAMIVFIYPWTVEASRKLPSELKQAVDVE